MELNLVNFFRISRAFSKVDELVVASDQVTPQHDFRLANHLENRLVQRSLDYTVIILKNEHVLLIASQRLRDQLRILDLIIVEPSTVSSDIFLSLWVDWLALLILGRDLQQAPTENEYRLLVDVGVGRTCLLVQAQPGVRLEAHQTHLMLSSDKKHDIAIGLFGLLKQLLFDHLGVIDKADEFPFAEVEHTLRHVERHMNYCDLPVLRIERLVGEQRVIYHPSLRHGLLRVVELSLVLIVLLLFVFFVALASYVSGEKVET